MSKGAMRRWAGKDKGEPVPLCSYCSREIKAIGIMTSSGKDMSLGWMGEEECWTFWYMYPTDEECQQWYKEERLYYCKRCETEVDVVEGAAWKIYPTEEQKMSSFL